jgi:uncharacterized protein YaaW (UPF0174 family)
MYAPLKPSAKCCKIFGTSGQISAQNKNSTKENLKKTILWDISDQLQSTIIPKLDKTNIEKI